MPAAAPAPALQEAIHDTLRCMPPERAVELANSIVLTGGTALLPGIVVSAP